MRLIQFVHNDDSRERERERMSEQRSSERDVDDMTEAFCFLSTSLQLESIYSRIRDGHTVSRVESGVYIYIFVYEAGKLAQWPGECGPVKNHLCLSVRHM